MSTKAVVGREVELSRISAFLAEVGEGRASALVLSGAPGIGKTMLWERGVEEAASRGQCVLAHRAVEAEAGLAFTGLADLLMPILDDVLPALAPPRRRALAVALLLEEPGDAPPDAAAIGLAVMDALSDLAGDVPVLVAIDDIQWLDSSTATVLPLALRRLEGPAVRTLATLRVAPEVLAPFELTRTFARLEELPLDPLGIGELHRLLKDRLGLELSRPELARVLAASGGNPFFALEIGRELVRSPGAIRVPASLREALGGRLARLPEATMGVLLTAAASARPTVELTVSASDAPQVATFGALDVAAREGVVYLEGDRVRFTHPLLASLCYEKAAPWKRRAVHARLATVIEDQEQRARHLALAADGADEAVALQLDEAVRNAAARGATAAAAELAELAVGRTPGDSSLRRSVAAHFHHLAGDFGRANELYAQLADELPPSVERADALYQRAVIGRERMPVRVRLCEEALRNARDDDARCADIHGFQAINRWILEDVPAALSEAREGLRRAERAGDARTLAVALARLGLIETWAMEMTPGLLERGVEIEAQLPEPLLFGESPGYFLAVRLLEIGELDRARAMFHEFEAGAVERGDEHSRQWCLLQLTETESYAGNLRLAQEHAAVARELAEQTGDPQFPAMIERAAAFVEADSGLLHEARASASRSLAHARTVSDGIQSISARAALGRVELVAGDLGEAIAHLRDLPGRQRRAGHFSRACDPWVDTIEVLIGLGELDTAQKHLDSYRELPSIAYRPARVGAARAQGLLHAARGDKDAALRALHELLAAEHSLAASERGRTLLALGTVQRQAQQRRAARDTLHHAVRLFESLGAKAWAKKARAELARISGRSAAASDDLTKAERQVAELAAEGRHNKEIAAALFIGVGTVERHLTNVYRKLGVRSRTELAGRLAKAGDEPAKV